MGLPALDAFPRKVWSQLVARHARGLLPADMAYPDPAGYAPLREAVAGYLATSRGVRCFADQILITIGYQDALNLVAGALLQRGDKVWLEDPNYPPAAEALRAAGASLVPIRVDAEGLRVSDGLARARRTRLAVVTPSHQSPLGVALSLPRRLALLSWARAAGAWIVEDDYDSEFRYVGRPLCQRSRASIATSGFSTSAPSARCCTRAYGSGISSYRSRWLPPSRAPTASDI
jgi:GntR family transcriptional regulator / MocR family aminotransferase